MSLTLTINKFDGSNNLGLPIDSTENFTANSITYTVSLKTIEFHKKMYSPNEIIADLQITGKKKVNDNDEDVTMAPNELETYFSGKEVELTYGSAIASGYYVHEIVPRREKNSTARFATLKIYSPDKLLTIDKYSRSYVAKKLYCDILMDENETSDSESDSMARKISLPYDPSKSLSSLLQFQTVPDFIGTATTEQIHPYLVQYNETFYDFLVRTANRWGIFLYFENGKLNFGYKKSTADELKNYKSIATYSIKQGTTLSVSLHSHNVEEPSKRVSIKQTEENIVDEVTSDEYRKSIKNGNYIYDKVIGEILVTDEEDDHARKVGGDGKYWMRKLADLLLKPYNVYSYLMTFIFDDWISYGRARAWSDRRNDKYKDKYFSGSFKNGIRTIKVDGKNTDTYLRKEQYEIKSSVSSPSPEDATSLFEFASAETKKCPNASNYEKVLTGETKASKNLICVDLGETYVHKLLGETFTLDGDTSTKYMVIQVDCVTETKTAYSVNTTEETLKDENGNNKTVKVVVEDKKTGETVIKTPVVSQHYRIIAVKQEGTDWYPPIHENGHVKTSGPQLAYVTDNDDPTRNMRYRVKYAWQSSADTDLPSPWLPVANAMASKESGAFFKFQKDDQVLLNYEAGNIERPYIVGAVQNYEKTAPILASLNIATLTTPAGQFLRLTDGTGAGVLPFFASMNPLSKLVQSYCDVPDIGNADTARSFEGGIDIGDKFGIYSIKASTNERNITIKSSLGDITLNAFTGIKIDAPNGDVKITGKNVTIEAGNNLTLKSGTNIRDGFFGDVHNSGKDFGKSLLKDALTPLMEKTASFIDLSVLRHTLEIFLKPVEGTLQIKSNRFMKLEAGKGSAGFPDYMVGNDRFGKKVQNFCSEFEKINAIAVTLFSNYLGRRQECSACYKAYSERFERFNRDYRQKSPNRQNKNVCTTPSTLLKNLWDKPAHSVVNENDLAFARTLRQIERQQDRTDLRIDAENLYHAIQSFKALIDRSGATAKLLIPEEFDGYPQKLKDAIEHHDNIARLPWPANNSVQTLVEFFTSNNDANNAGNISIARKLGISIAIKYISILEGQADPNALTSVDNHNFPIIAPVNFTADDFNTQWKEYVDGLTFISGINDKEKNEFSKNMKDMFFDNFAIISNCTDSFVWGGDNNAAILMSSGDDTYLMNNKGQLEKVEAEYKTRSNYALAGFDLKSQYTLNKIKRILRGINGIGGVVQ